MLLEVRGQIDRGLLRRLELTQVGLLLFVEVEADLRVVRDGTMPLLDADEGVAGDRPEAALQLELALHRVAVVLVHRHQSSGAGKREVD